MRPRAFAPSIDLLSPVVDEGTSLRVFDVEAALVNGAPLHGNKTSFNVDVSSLRWMADSLLANQPWYMPNLFLVSSLAVDRLCVLRVLLLVGFGQYA